MRVGISTVHYAHNYGAMLQGYALKRYCENNGCEVYMTDRRRKILQKWSPRKIEKFSLKSILLYPKYLYKWYLPKYLPIRKREHCFEHFLEKYLNDKPLPPNIDFDLIIYGSDQIWSKYDYGFNKIWWGYDNLTTKKRISYAASMGIVDINKEDEPFVKEALSQFSAISVRETDLYEELINRKLVDKENLQIVIDPTFLLRKEEWLKITSARLVKESYLLFYDFQVDRQTTEIVKTIARERNLKIVRITNGIESDDESDFYFKSMGPAEFLSLLYYSNFVFSSSFHGVAFSIIFEKQFATRQIWNTSRVRSLLEHSKLSDRFIDKKENCSQLNNIDYNEVAVAMRNILKTSTAFLDANISNISQ